MFKGEFSLQYYNVGLLPMKCISVVVSACPVQHPFIVSECRGFC